MFPHLLWTGGFCLSCSLVGYLNSLVSIGSKCCVLVPKTLVLLCSGDFTSEFLPHKLALLGEQTDFIFLFCVTQLLFCWLLLEHWENTPSCLSWVFPLTSYFLLFCEMHSSFTTDLAVPVTGEEGKMHLLPLGKQHR